MRPGYYAGPRAGTGNPPVMHVLRGLVADDHGAHTGSMVTRVVAVLTQLGLATSTVVRGMPERSAAYVGRSWPRSVQAMEVRAAVVVAEDLLAGLAGGRHPDRAHLAHPDAVTEASTAEHEHVALLRDLEERRLQAAE